MDLLGQTVDYSWARPAPLTIALAGFKGALRYLSYEPGKNISVGEADALLAVGLDYGLVWETTANMMLRGAAGGAQDSQEANRQADALGSFGADRPIYYACDFDAQPGQYGTLAAYLNACTGREAGFYGPYGPVEWLANNTSTKRFWQCAAWSGIGNGSGGSVYQPGDGTWRRLSQFASLFQNVGYVLNNTSDSNNIYQPDWGQSKGLTPPPPPPPEDPVAYSPVYELVSSDAHWSRETGYLPSDGAWRRDPDTGAMTPWGSSYQGPYFHHLSADEETDKLSKGNLAGTVVLPNGTDDDRRFSDWPHDDNA